MPCCRNLFILCSPLPSPSPNLFLHALERKRSVYSGLVRCIVWILRHEGSDTAWKMFFCNSNRRKCTDQEKKLFGLVSVKVTWFGPDVSSGPDQDRPKRDSCLGVSEATESDGEEEPSSRHAAFRRSVGMVSACDGEKGEGSRALGQSDQYKCKET